MKAWPALIVDAISSLEPRMKLAMKATGSRESWLQIEVMMYAADQHRCLYTNYAQVDPKDASRKFDWAAYEDDEDDNKATMVAEVKIMSGDYLAKCLFGRDATNWRTYRNRPLTISKRRIEKCIDNGWGLMTDAARLLKTKVSERYLVLVLLDLRPRNSASERTWKHRQELHAVMTKINFIRKPIAKRSKKGAGYKVKVWSLSG